MSPPPNPQEVLKELIEHEDKLDWAYLCLEELGSELETYTNEDPRRPRAMAVFLQTRYKLARQYADLAIVKAEFGIVGNTWYKQNDKKQ